ncbi:hypothetical protein, partial [Endozoicomonas sp. ONNA2]|uniref:hypothetical protein n=1 Tax=Endozoicomonas sp. ONNA2 TaxID=2828741 RepID=UPI0021479D18
DQFIATAVGQSILGQPPGAKGVFGNWLADSVGAADLSYWCRRFCEAFLVLPFVFSKVSSDVFSLCARLRYRISASIERIELIAGKPAHNRRVGKIAQQIIDL